ncbi:MAG: ArsR family transcriptional regulator, partial [Pseudomonadota bacterium]|nr:ArsR family transcriptional regulator [Pseudomonadota bacterium]
MTQQLVFRAISDPTRRSIMALLATREQSLNEIAANYDMTRPAVTKHLNILNTSTLSTFQPSQHPNIVSTSTFSTPQHSQHLNILNHLNILDIST